MEEFRGDGIGDVQGEIADLHEIATVFVVVECGEVAEEKSAGLGALDEFQVSGFACLDDARCGEDDAAWGGARGCDGVLVTAGGLRSRSRFPGCPLRVRLRAARVCG